MNWELFGICAGLVALSGFVPQIVKGFKTKKMNDLSYFLGGLMSIGMIMWVIYGIQQQSLSIILTNSIGVTLNVILIIMKYHYSKKTK